MHVILTHEQADFDAVASLLAAHLVDDAAIPVLPRKMNRNVRSFVTLYGTELPLLEAADLPAGAIDFVTLVDTQSLVTLKGMGSKTKVRVIDHHPPRKDLPANWEVITPETGATSTALVESLQERYGTLTMIQATLILLGIYEDTGSLSYASTTLRDLRAAAYLLEQGADLRLAAEYLNPPLTREQRVIYDRLAANAQTHYVHGHRVIITCGDANQMNEEVSSLAHKLRDLFDPDALFVLLTTGEGVRLVARSTTDQIDVAAVAAHFGGGGHERAAAALVRPQKTESAADALSRVCQELLGILPRHVQPSVTVSQIMSKRPHMVSAETPVQEAARLMQRYGYEGFPVVRDGRVIGLLTRRAVDRALSHKLSLKAASLMEAGEVFVNPEDSLQILQSRMTDSGWGQIPVVDSSSHHIVGIVTRTDLLKTLASRPALARRQNLANRLEQALPAERLMLIRAVAGEASSQKLPLYIVGGFVRDLLLEHPSLDFDLVVEGDAIALARAMAARHGGRVTSHTRFGTAKWFLVDSEFSSRRRKPSAVLHAADFLDFISARMEFYTHPTALPTVERGSIKLDLHRRDFTINTLAIRLDGRHFGELLDYWGGMDDLLQGVIRVLHSLSFVDDPTRMLRAVRFEQRFHFYIELRTLQLMDEARPLLERLSGERIRHELDLIMAEENASAMLGRLAELNLLQAIHPALPWNASLQRQLSACLIQQPPKTWENLRTLGRMPFRQVTGYLLWLSELTLTEIQDIAARLRFPLALKKGLMEAARLNQDLPGMAESTPSAVVERMEDVPLIVLHAVYLRAPRKVRALIERYVTQWRKVKPTTNGNTLKKQGVPPGPAYQRILGRLRAAWLNGEVTTRAEEMALLDELLEEESQRG